MFDTCLCINDKPCAPPFNSREIRQRRSTHEIPRAAVCAVCQPGTYARSGTLWEGRFRSSIIQQDEYLFSCHRYIEMNPVRAGIVKHPGEYRWSSYQRNGQGESFDLLTPHVLYQSLGKTDAERQGSYRELFRYELESISLR